MGAVSRLAPVDALVDRAIAALLPRADRETILGDLLEEGDRPGSRRGLAAVSGIVLHVHSEPYREEAVRVRMLISVVLGLALVLAVGAAGWGAEATLDLYSDPISRLAIKLWGAPHLTSAVAAGLLVGHAPWIQRHADLTRWHTGVLLAGLSCWVAPATGLRMVPGLLLLAAVWLGDNAREDEQTPPVVARR